MLVEKQMKILEIKNKIKWYKETNVEYFLLLELLYVTHSVYVFSY